MRRVLVVAHQTLDSAQLDDAMRDELARGPCTFHVVVPVRHDSNRGTWTEADVRAVAAERLDTALARFRAEGLPVTGEVGDSSPVTAVGDVLLREGRGAFDLVLVSTLPHGFSRWLKLDAPTRIARSFEVPVRHVVAQTTPVA